MDEANILLYYIVLYCRAYSVVVACMVSSTMEVVFHMVLITQHPPLLKSASSEQHVRKPYTVKRSWIWLCSCLCWVEQGYLQLLPHQQHVWAWVEWQSEKSCVGHNKDSPARVTGEALEGFSAGPSGWSPTPELWKTDGDKLGTICLSFFSSVREPMFLQISSTRHCD